jgi:hypothetical protein
MREGGREGGREGRKEEAVAHGTYLGEEGGDGFLVLGDQQLHPEVADHEVRGTGVFIHQQAVRADLGARAGGREGGRGG